MGPTAHTWLSKFFSRIMATHSIPKIWRKAKVIAVEKPGKDPSLAATYRPISLLSVCYTSSWSVLHSSAFLPQSKVYSVQARLVSGKVEALMIRLQAAALTTFVENGFQQNLKTGAVFLDLK